MALTRVTAGSEASIDDLNQLIDLLQGTAGFTETFLLRCATSTDFKVRLSDASGARKFIVQDSAGTDVAYVDSDGNLTILGTFAPATLVLPAATSPAQTAEGSAIWDSNDDILTVGDGASRKQFGYLGTTAPSAAGTPAAGTSFEVARIDHVHLGPTFKYKSATQVITTTTTHADVNASSGTFSYAIAANEVWESEYWIPLAFGGTGGAKFRITGPAAATDVNITGTRVSTGTIETGLSIVTPLTPVTAFSSDIGAFNSAALGSAAVPYPNNATDCFIHIRARVINGANAGTVTLQAAQNSSNSTTTLGLGSFMRAERIG